MNPFEYTLDIRASGEEIVLRAKAVEGSFDSRATVRVLVAAALACIFEHKLSPVIVIEYFNEIMEAKGKKATA